MTVVPEGTRRGPPAVLVLAFTLAVGVLVGVLAPEGEAGAVRSGALLAAPAAIAGFGWLLRHRRRVVPEDAGAFALATLAAVLVGCYVVWVLPSLLLRGDVLLWSESQVVSDIIKLRTGAPLYAPPADLSSSIYTPGVSIATWLVATIAGAGDSVAAYRIIQLVAATLAAVVASGTVKRILPDGGQGPSPATWAAFRLLVLFLFATNAITNPFAHLIHNDSMALLVSAVGFDVVVRYARAPRTALLLPMVLVPALGYLIKQSLAAWAALFMVQLLATAVVQRPVRWRMPAAYLALVTLALALTEATCRLVWGASFHYWTFTALGNHPTSVLRSLQHVLDTWVFFAVGLAGGWYLVVRQRQPWLLGPWAVWLLLLSGEAYTSGIAWMVNHLGPGSLVAGVLGLAGLQLAWSRPVEVTVPAWSRWLGTCALGALVALALSGIGGVRIPVGSVGDSTRRYVADIDAEFAGMDPATVLLDMGSWVYLDAGVVMRDRSAVVGDLGIAGVGDFSGILSRIHARAYRRILVHDFDTPDLLYDHRLWQRSSGIRAALEQEYRVVRVIPAPTGGWQHITLHAISVLEPRTGVAGGEGP